jgi:HD-GYP domain-containing protein (c-di-GMP phosphodiesterase class II)
MEDNQFYPIHLDSLVSASTLEFNLYIKTTDEKCILFRERSLEFGERHRKKLLANEIHTLYIRQADQRIYGRYIEENIGSLMKDPSVPSEKKAAFIYSVSKGILQDAFENPRAIDIVRRTEGLTVSTVDYILKGNESIQNLIAIMSTDYYTFTHSMNVCVFTVALASTVGVRFQRELNDLATGALLHDIGKSEVPKTLLSKAGPLLPEEMAVMKQHVVWGERILGGNPLMTPTRMLPVSLHHEKLDGRGYPRGLIGDQIHLHGRIVAIADCFDAMTTNRSYQSAMDGYDALHIMRTKLHAQYDQDILHAFIPLLRKAS